VILRLCVRTVNALIAMIGRPVVLVAVIGVVDGILRLISRWVYQCDKVSHRDFC
jgi:hypothetical protein